MNEILWIIMLFLNFSFILLAYKFWGKMGLYLWVAISTILANIQVLKSIELFGMSLTLGNILYASSFLVTDILSENYGLKESKKAINIGFFALITMTILMNLSIYFVPSPQDFGHESIKTIFNFMPRLVCASLTAYFISQTHDVYAFEFWRKLLPADKYFWVRNNFSTLFSQFIDTAIFTFIAFWDVFEVDYLITLIFTTYIIKVIIAIADTPFLYIAKRMYKKKNI